jgi:hypothetical protein
MFLFLIDHEGKEAGLVRRPREARPDGRTPSPDHYRFSITNKRARALGTQYVQD